MSPRPEVARPSRAAGRTRRRYATRLPVPARTEQLLDAALELVGEGGFDAVRMQAVARRAGVTRPVVYECFAGREELLTALVTRETAHLRALYAEVARTGDGEGPKGARRMPVRALATLLAEVRRAPATWRLLYVALDTLPDGTRDELATARGELTEVIRARFAVYAATLGLPADLDAEVAVPLLRAMVDVAAQRVLLDPDRYPPARLTAALRGVLGALSEPAS
ncbi:MAG TPA: helix-turn-helix domain-containing protein [Pseudonocardia sp.]|nr:helix-turn-helix domain-containing protein [Pseudonocardia sp.]